MSYRVQVYYAEFFEQHIVSSQAKALALAKLKKAEGWSTVCIIWPTAEGEFVGWF